MPGKGKSKGADDGVGYKSPVSPTEPKTPPPPAGPPGSPMEIIFSFDTTGSMYSLLDEVRKNVSNLIRRLQGDIPNIRIGVIAHGDYCDEKTAYVIKMVDFSRDTEDLVKFVNHVGRTSGGDGDECYELALKTARTQFTWSRGTQRSLVMIGDAAPHEKTYPFYKTHTPIDWRVETDKLAAMGVHIYGVSCDARGSDKKFYEDIAQKTDGTFLEMKEFTNIFDMICAICYKEHGAEYFHAYEKEVRDREKRMLNKDLDCMLKTLRKSASNASTMSLKDSDPPPTPAATLKRVAPTAVVAPTPAKRVRIVTPPKAKKPKSKKLVKTPKPSKKFSKFAKPKPSSKAKKPKKTVPKRLLRENVSRVSSPKQASRWSEWVPLLSNTRDGTFDSKRVRGIGYRNSWAFAAESDLPALYEVAVSPPKSSSKYVVYIRVKRRIRGSLDTELFSYFRKGDKLIDSILAKNCTVYCRRAVVPVNDPTSTFHSSTRLYIAQHALTKKYDYAWRKCSYGRTGRRDVTKNGVSISTSKS